MPLVSIIIPVYNTEKYLDEAIKSAINQIWPDKEIIIIDDGSTDNSLAIAKKHESKNVKVISQQNAGAGVARNRGLKEASGDYIQFLDADDLLSINKISEQVKLLIQNPGKIAVCSTVHFFENESPYTNSPTPYEDSFLYTTDKPIDFLINLYGGNHGNGSMIQTNAWLTPASIVKKAGEWSELYSSDDDGNFFFRAVLSSTGVVYASDCFNYYRKYKHNNSVAGAKNQHALNGKFQSFIIKKEGLLRFTNSIEAKKALAHSAMGLIVECYPANKVLTKKLSKIIKDLGGTTYIPELGGKYIEFIKRTLGWKIARLIQYYFQKIG